MMRMNLAIQLMREPASRLLRFALVALPFAVGCQAALPDTYIPFEVPRGYVLLSAAEANEEFSGNGLFEIGGIALKHPDGALIYTLPQCVIPPERSPAEIRRELLEFLENTEERYSWPIHKIQEKKAFVESGIQWIWIAGETFQRGRMCYFIHAQSELHHGTSELHALAPVEAKDSIRSTFMQAIESMTATFLRKD